jgi:hypothetical protein
MAHGNLLLLRPYVTVSMTKVPSYLRVHRFAAGAVETGMYVNTNPEVEQTSNSFLEC